MLIFVHAEHYSDTEKGDFLLWKNPFSLSCKTPWFFPYIMSSAKQFYPKCQVFQWPLILCKYSYPKWTDQLGVRAKASGEAKGAADPPPPGPVKPDTSSLWMELFCLDSVILILETCNVCHFHIWGRFFGDISRDKCWK